MKAVLIQIMQDTLSDNPITCFEYPAQFSPTDCAITAKNGKVLYGAVPDLLEWAGRGETYDDAKAVLQGIVNDYDQWCAGDVWMILINDTHQCGGYYGYDYAISCITEFVPDFDPQKAQWIQSANGWLMNTTTEGDF